MRVLIQKRTDGLFDIMAISGGIPPKPPAVEHAVLPELVPQTTEHLMDVAKGAKPAVASRELF